LRELFREVWSVRALFRRKRAQPPPWSGVFVVAACALWVGAWGQFSCDVVTGQAGNHGSLQERCRQVAVSLAGGGPRLVDSRDRLEDKAGNTCSRKFIEGSPSALTECTSP
jgi:hypothetical protein